MRVLIGLALLFISFEGFAVSVRGHVQMMSGCNMGKAMVWLSLNEKDHSKKLLLLHTSVPDRGSFEFYVKPGEYLLVASTEEGCAAEQVVRVQSESPTIELKLKAHR